MPDAVQPVMSAPRAPWAARVSRLRVAGAAAVVALLLWVVGGALDWLVVHSFLPPLPMVVADLAVAAVAGLLVYRVLADSRERHLAIVERLELIAEMNHHIRNALQIIAYSIRREHPGDEKAIAQVDEAVTRIEWALREVLPPHNK